MAASVVKLLAAAAFIAASIASAAAQQDRSSLPITLDAASSDVDYRENRVRFRDVVVSQGDTTVQAERAEATGLDFEDAQWVFEGDVRIRVASRGTLRSARAVVDFRDNRIERAMITGSPAEFEQRRAEEEMVAQGRAGAIEYAVDDGTVRLSEDAWLSDGRNEIRGPVLVYSIREERVQAASEPGGSERVRILIKPEQGREPAREPRDSRP